jgi:cell fate regulator YaaT (PSP1 superfamily)
MSAVLVQYGRGGFVGRFAAREAFARGARVVVRGPRGVEVGTVLCAADGAHPDGDTLRAATECDAPSPEREAELLSIASAEIEAQGLPLALVDAELTLDGALILHGLAWAECDADPLFAELSARFALTVQFLDLGRVPVAKEPTGCGKPGCGTDKGGCSSCGTSNEGGGCSSGSCSRGAAKSADELTAYFADLRTKMEAARVPLH